MGRAVVGSDRSARLAIVTVLLVVLFDELLEGAVVEGDRRGQSVAHAESEAVDGCARHDEGFDREDDIASSST